MLFKRIFQILKAVLVVDMYLNVLNRTIFYNLSQYKLSQSHTNAGASAGVVGLLGCCYPFGPAEMRKKTFYNHFSSLSIFFAKCRSAVFQQIFENLIENTYFFLPRALGVVISNLFVVVVVSSYPKNFGTCLVQLYNHQFILPIFGLPAHKAGTFGFSDMLNPYFTM